MAAIDSPWLTASEAAVYARRGKRKILAAVKTGKLRAAIVGGKRQVLTRREWLDQMIADEVDVAALPARRRA
jgi:excisionase family DNA binding protein